MNSAGLSQRGVKLLRFGDVRKELAHRRDAVGFFLAPREHRSYRLKKLIGVAEEEIILVAVVNIESGAADSRPIKHVLHRDRVKRLLLHENDQRVSQTVAGTQHAAVSFLFRLMRMNSLGFFVFGHSPPFCSLSPVLAL